MVIPNFQTRTFLGLQNPEASRVMACLELQIGEQEQRVNKIHVHIPTNIPVEGQHPQTSTTARYSVRVCVCVGVCACVCGCVCVCVRLYVCVCLCV